ncbi:hypothetical protein LWI28_001400 [Acer negundo]|uniref:Uncharacterized protein n=1 Tax=Acer negundo TaxID=4023 RepID=A0AAD5J294_ACENE|nr:hypothetical protein LWI28_001400 [Acer negundo]
MRCQTFKFDKIAKKAINGMNRLKVGKVGEKRDTLVVNRDILGYRARLVSIERGKKKWVGRPRKKPLTFVIRNGKLDSEKRNNFVKDLARFSEDSSFSSEVKTINRLFLNSEKVRGECSIKRLQSFAFDGANVDQSSGPELVKRGSLIGGPSKPNGVASIPINQGPRICVDLGSIEATKALEKGMPLERLAVEVAVAIPVKAAVSFGSISSKKERMGSGSTSKHMMKTRNSKVWDSWDF